MNISGSKPWIDPGDNISKMSGNREGFEVLRAAIDSLLEGDETHVNILHDGIGIEELELQETQDRSDTANESCLVKFVGCLFLIAMASTLILAYFGLKYVSILLFK